ncbi:MAG: hypothetical protein CMD31_10215 [Flavobacteriales bacterium]|jgi:uncharacterized protein DUF3575|nr:hypothetical protein [Flavobacteriales bacterium]
MKFSKIIILISIVSCLSDVFSQINVVKVDFSNIGVGKMFGLAYNEVIFRPSFERTFGKNFSTLITYEFGKYETGELEHTPSNTEVTRIEEVYNVKGWGIMPEVRFYLPNKRRTAPTGFFMGLHYRYRHITENFIDSKNVNNRIILSDTTISNDAIMHDYGFNLGYKLVFSGRIGADLLMGYGYSFGKWKTETDRNKIDSFFAKQMDGFENRLRLEISLAYFFPKIKIIPREIKVIDGPYLEH